APTLHLLQSATVPGDPVAIDGARVLLAPGSGVGIVPAEAFTVIVVTKPDSSGAKGKILAYPNGNVTLSPIVNTFDGTPVALVATVCSTFAYAYVATTSPNQVVKYVATLSGRGPVETLDLGTATPLAMTLSLPSGSVGTGAEEI